MNSRNNSRRGSRPEERPREEEATGKDQARLDWRKRGQGRCLATAAANPERRTPPRIAPLHAHTSRLSAPHPLGEKHAADYPRHEIRRRGKAAPCTGRRFRGAALRAGNSARAAFGGRAHGSSGASAARARPEEKILVVVLTGDRSLAGAFNANVLRHAMEFIRETSAQKIELIVVGKKGRDTLRKRGYSFVGEYWTFRRTWNFPRPRKSPPGSPNCTSMQRSGRGLRDLQRIQERDGAEPARREIAAHRS